MPLSIMRAKLHIEGGHEAHTIHNDNKNLATFEPKRGIGGTRITQFAHEIDLRCSGTPCLKESNNGNEGKALTLSCVCALLTWAQYDAPGL